jgi:MoxR-like ATPase
MRLELTLDLSLISRVPLLVWGPPGVGKTATIRAWAERRGLRCWTVVASLREPADFGGLPIVDLEGSRSGNEGRPPSVTFAPPRFAIEAAAEGGVIFLDELTSAPPAVQAALLRAVVDRAFGDLEMEPSRVAIVAAANPTGEAAGGWDLAAPLVNRFTHVRYELTANEWTEAFLDYWGRPPELSFWEQSVNVRRWSRARSLMAAFLRSRPSLLLQVPDDVSRRGEAWPSPRSWDYATRLIAAAERHCREVA